MDLIALDSAFQPSKLIENYESLIWSERYTEAGDFQLSSPDIGSILKQMPLESVVSLRESSTPMVVESHKIVKPTNGLATIEVTGRSFETVLERRVTIPSPPVTSNPPVIMARPQWVLNADTPSDAAYKAIRSVLGDNVARSNLPPLAPGASPADAIPQINLPLPSDYSTGLAMPFEIKGGSLYSVVLELISANRHGIRALRPPVLGGKTTVDIQIYNGANLTGSGENSDPNIAVVFDARFDQFDSSTYLLTKQGSTNVAYVYGSNGAQQVNKNTAPEPTGLNRRVVLVDESGDDSLNSPDIRKNRGLSELYNNNELAIFDGEISVQVAALFNKPVAEGGYGLGDIIKLVGEYGLSRNVRVAEFIRTSDASGQNAYPAFEAVDE